MTAGGHRLPVVDLRRRMHPVLPDLLAAVERVLRSGQLLLGPETAAFERELASWAGRRHVVAVASATEGLRLALAALGLGPGDEVVVPALTAVPTAAAVCAAGATPVFADVDPATAALDPASAEACRTDRTRAVVPVHLYGRPAPLPALGVPVVEDAAQAQGALDPASGSAFAVYSFYPTKNLGGIGDGGAVVTDDDELAERVRRLRVHGQRDGYEHTDVATNARLSEIEAAGLRVLLPRLDAQNARRREIAAAYRDAAPDLRWQADDPRHVYHLCVVRVPDRDAWRASLPFTTGVHYPRALTQQPAYARFVRAACPQAESWAAECVSLPCFPEMTDEEVEDVCRALR